VAVVFYYVGVQSWFHNLHSLSGISENQIPKSGWGCENAIPEALFHKRSVLFWKGVFHKREGEGYDYEKGFP